MQTFGMNITTIIFDLGGVLIDWNPRYLYRKLFKEESDMEHFLENICHGEWNLLHDAGKPFAEGVREKVLEHPGYEQYIRAYADRWPEMLNGEISGTVEILKKLHADAKYRLLALTNWSSETFPVAKRDYRLLDLFEGILVSGDEKLVKPDRRIYELLISRFNIKPDEAVFIDDSEKNVLGARAVGLHAIHFKDPETLANSLRTMGVSY